MLLFDDPVIALPELGRLCFAKDVFITAGLYDSIGSPCSVHFPGRSTGDIEI